MNNCIGCMLKYVFDNYSPIYISCSHDTGVSSLVRVRRSYLVVHYLIFLGVLAKLMFDLNLLINNYCIQYTFECMLFLNYFNFALIATTIIFLKFLNMRATVDYLNGWIKLYECRNIFCIHYISLQNEANLLKRKRIVFNIIIYSFMACDTILRVTYVYSNEFILIRLVLDLFCGYVPAIMFFECILYVTTVILTFKRFTNSIVNNLLLALSPSDRFYYYKSFALIYKIEENSSLLQKLEKLIRFYYAFVNNVEFVNNLYRPLAIFWFLLLTVLLITNFYVVVNADYENYGERIIVMVTFLVCSVLVLLYIVTTCEQIVNKVSN